MKKIFVAALLCVTLGGTLLAGCGSKTANEAPGSVVGTDEVNSATVDDSVGDTAVDGSSVSNVVEETSDGDRADDDFWYVLCDVAKSSAQGTPYFISHNDYFGYRGNPSLWGHAVIDYLFVSADGLQPDGAWSDSVDYLIEDGCVYLIDRLPRVAIKFDTSELTITDGKTELDVLNDLGIIEAWSDFSDDINKSPDDMDLCAYEEGEYIYYPTMNIRVKNEAVNNGYGTPRVEFFEDFSQHVVTKTSSVYALWGVNSEEQAADYYVNMWNATVAGDPEQYENFEEFDRRTVTIDGFSYLAVGVQYTIITNPYPDIYTPDAPFGPEFPYSYHIWFLVSEDSGYCIVNMPDTDLNRALGYHFQKDSYSLN